MPSVAERAGDFSTGSPFTGTLQNQFLADSLAARPGCVSAAAAGGGSSIEAGAAWAAVFPGNKIPSPCIDATAADLLQQFVPLPSSGDNTYQSAPVKRENAFQPTVRIDQTINARNSLSFYYYFDDSSIQQPFSTFQSGGANLSGFGAKYRTRAQQSNLSHTSSPSASTVNEARFSYLREGQSAYNHPENTNLVQKSCSNAPAEACFSDPFQSRIGHPSRDWATTTKGFRSSKSAALSQ